MIADGLFFHPDGDRPAHVLNRMVDGTTNPRLDDVFAPALDATDRELEKLNEQIKRAKDRLRKLVIDKRHAIKLQEDQQKAVAKYAQTGAPAAKSRAPASPAPPSSTATMTRACRG